MSIIKFFRQIWNDSVWSKVIATIIFPYILLALGALKSIFTDETYIKALCKVLSYDIPLWFVILLIWTIVWIVYAIYIWMKHKELKKQQEVIHYKNPFITFKNESTYLRYCANCWENDHKRVQLTNDCFDSFECPVCHTKGNFEELEERHHSDPFDNSYYFLN